MPYYFKFLLIWHYKSNKYTTLENINKYASRRATESEKENIKIQNIWQNAYANFPVKILE